MVLSKISDIKAREIIDCRGWPTVQAEVHVDGRLMGRADVPAGLSTGSHEAQVLLDGEPNRYRGRGVLKAVENVNTIVRPALLGWTVTEQRKIDMAMLDLDGTPNKSRLGANAILGVSLAVARAAANACGVPLYRYINPVAGGSTGDGWPFGRSLSLSEVYAIIQGTTDVDYIEEVKLFPVKNGERQEAITRISVSPDSLLCSHRHEVVVE